MRGRNPPWTDLPQELLSTIANFLTSNTFDLLTFRSICHSWRSSIPKPISSSILSPLLPLHISFSPNHGSRYSLLSASSVFVLHPSSSSSSPLMPNSWLLFLDEGNPGKVCVRKPFSNLSYFLPFDFPCKLNLLGFHSVFLGRFYNLSYVSNPSMKPNNWANSALKVVLSDESYVVVIFDHGKLGLLRLGVASVGYQWQVVRGGKGFRFDDIIEFKGKVLAVDRTGRMYEINCAELKMNSVCNPIAAGGGRRKRLVESFGVLNLVVRCTPRYREDQKMAFKVYEFNELRKKWLQITSIGDRIFFIGWEFSLSVSALEFRESLGKNCIIYKSESFPEYHDRCDDHFLYMGDPNLCVGVWHLGADSIEPVESFPGYSNVFWPPPNWIWPDHKSKRVGLLKFAMDSLLGSMEYQDMKAKLKEHYCFAEAVASFGDFTKQNIVEIFTQPKMTWRFLKDTSLVIDQDLQRIQLELQEEALKWQKCSKYKCPLSQVRTSNRKNEGHSDSSLPLTTSEHTNNVKDWFSRELDRRTKTHMEVKAILEHFIDFLEANSTKLEDLRRLPKPEQELSLLLLIRQSGTPISKYFS